MFKTQSQILIVWFTYLAYLASWASKSEYLSTPGGQPDNTEVLPIVASWWLGRSSRAVVPW